MSQQFRQEMSESFLVGALLAVSGGFLDAYTYLVRGHVFANAVTGNMVLFGLSAAEKEWGAAGVYLTPILAYACGVLLAERLHRVCKTGRYDWRQAILAVEMAVAAVSAFLPFGVWNTVVNTAVAFICAMQVEAFRTMSGSLAFATTMCTGNLRSGSELLFHAIEDHDRTAFQKCLRYFSIIVIFILGAMLCVPMAEHFGAKAILFAELPWAYVQLLLLAKPDKNS